MISAQFQAACPQYVRVASSLEAFLWSFYDLLLMFRTSRGILRVHCCYQTSSSQWIRQKQKPENFPRISQTTFQHCSGIRVHTRTNEILQIIIKNYDSRWKRSSKEMPPLLLFVLLARTNVHFKTNFCFFSGSNCVQFLINFLVFTPICLHDATRECN